MRKPVVLLGERHIVGIVAPLQPLLEKHRCRGLASQEAQEVVGLTAWHLWRRADRLCEVEPSIGEELDLIGLEEGHDARS